MPGLSLTARKTLATYGVSAVEWARYWFGPEGVWRGDSCGCPDVCCVGHHHAEGLACPCVRFGLRGLLAHSSRQAA